MPKFNNQRLAKTAAGDPAELCVNVVRGNGTSRIHVTGGSFEPQVRDGLVSAISFAGTTLADFTATASFTGHGSLDPGADVGVDQAIITWYRFEG